MSVDVGTTGRAAEAHLRSPCVQPQVHIRRRVGHQSWLRGCGRRGAFEKCREGRSEVWLHVSR